MNTLLIVNPYCRNGDVDISEAVDVLKELGQVEIFRIGGEKTAAERIDELKSSIQRIVVAGGDGTLNSVLRDVKKSGLPVGILPLGTANDFARSLELPDDPVEAARTIVSNSTRRVDVSVANDHLFLNAVGIGLGPDLTKEMDREKKRRLGIFAYLESLIHVFYRRRRQYAFITVDGVTKRMPFVQITIANGRHYGGGMTICDDARIDDGLLHLLCVRPLTPWQLFARGLRMKFGAVKDDDKLYYVSGNSIRVDTRRPCDVTADGELVSETPLQCHVEENALEVYVPRQEAGVRSSDMELALNKALRPRRDQAAAVPA